MTLQGSAAALKYAHRDIPHLDEFVKLCPQRRVAVQAGGNLGVYPKRLAESFGTVYTFEPSPELFPKLVANAPEQNIIRIQAALGQEAGSVGTACCRRDGSGKPVHEGLTHVAGDGPIPRMRLDDFALPCCDFLQLDLEGYELFALRGATATIAKHRPVVVVEVNGNVEFYGHKREEVGWLLGSFGYRSVRRLKSDEVFVPC